MLYFPEQKVNEEDYIFFCIQILSYNNALETVENGLISSIVGEKRIFKSKLSKLVVDFLPKILFKNQISENEGVFVVACPISLFENDNIGNFLSFLYGAFIENDSVIKSKISYIHFPDQYFEKNSKYNLGKAKIEEKLETKNKNILGATLKPKILNPTETYEIALRLYRSGVRIIFDDLFMTDQNFNPFYERVSAVSKARREVQSKTSQRHLYFPCISARFDEMYARIKYAREFGESGALIDFQNSSISTIAYLRRQFPDMFFAIHRLFIGLKGFFSMSALRAIADIAGGDLVFINPNLVENDESSDFEKIKMVAPGIKKNRVKAMITISGGLNAKIISSVSKSLNENVIFNVGGGLFIDDKIEENVKLIYSKI